jgi:hypothetical protein
MDDTSREKAVADLKVYLWEKLRTVEPESSDADVLLGAADAAMLQSTLDSLSPIGSPKPASNLAEDNKKEEKRSPRQLFTMDDDLEQLT